MTTYKLPDRRNLIECTLISHPVDGRQLLCEAYSTTRRHGRRVVVRESGTDGYGPVLFDTDDQYDASNAEYVVNGWLKSQQEG